MGGMTKNQVDQIKRRKNIGSIFFQKNIQFKGEIIIV